MSPRQGHDGGERGFIMVALLVGMAVTAVWMSALLPTWRQQAQRQREDDLIFRGEQYARAIALFSVKNNGALPTSIDDLVQQRYLRRKWKDPITGKDFMVLGSGAVSSPGAGTGTSAGTGRGGQQGGTPSPQQGSGLMAAGITGVYSESTDTSIRIYNNAQQYNQWVFTYQGALLRMGRIGGGQPRGGDGRGGTGGRGVQPGRGGRGVNPGAPRGSGQGNRSGAPPAGRGSAPAPPVRGGGAGGVGS